MYATISNCEGLQSPIVAISPVFLCQSFLYHNLNTIICFLINIFYLQELCYIRLPGSTLTMLRFIH